MQGIVHRQVSGRAVAQLTCRAFPTGAQRNIGYELQLSQFGEMPKDAKPFIQRPGRSRDYSLDRPGPWTGSRQSGPNAR